MTDKTGPGKQRFVGPLIGVLSVVPMVVFVVIAVMRLDYPYELEWLESGVLEHTRRLVEGQTLYSPPSIDFVQFPYPPLYMAVSALLALVFGADFSTLRAVSLLSTIGIFVVLFFIVRRETGKWWAGLFAAGVYAACYRHVGGWFDIAKIDSLFLFLCLASLYLVRRATTFKVSLVAGLVLALSIMAKQTGMFIAAPVFLYLALTRRRQAAGFGLGVGAGVGGITAVMEIASHGWFFYFVWEQLTQHSQTSASKWYLFSSDAMPFWPAALLILAAVPLFWKKPNRWMAGLYGAAAVGMLAGSWASRIHEGGYTNVIMPACAALAIGAGLSVGWLLEHHRRWLLVTGVAILCVLQLLFLRYDINKHLPTEQDRMAGAQFVERLRNTPGEVLVVSHPTYVHDAGKRVHAQQGGTNDVLRSENDEARRLVMDSYARAIYEQRYALIVLDSDRDADAFPANWTDYYRRLAEPAIADPDAFRTVTDQVNRPEQLWVPVPR